MAIISGVLLKAFRGVREGLVDGLSPTSILVGPNNSGKSTCLEAIATVAAGPDGDRVARQLMRRGGPVFDALEHIVAEGSEAAELEVSRKGGQTCTTKLVLPDVRDTELIRDSIASGLKEPLMQLDINASLRADSSVQHYAETIVTVDSESNISTPFLRSGSPFATFPYALVDVQTVSSAGALEDAYSRIERAGKVKAVVDALRRSMPGLTDLRILKTKEHFILHAIIEKERPVPVYLAGDGSKRFIELASAILGVEDQGVVLLEEPECYQHPRYLSELAGLLLFSAKRGRQIILSTHSIELIDVLLEAGEEAGAVEENENGRAYPMVHRLRLVEGKLSAVALDRTQALVSRKDLLEDLRA